MKLCYRHNINNLIALCHVVEDFEDFYIKFKNESQHESHRSSDSFLYDLNIISSGKKIFGKKNIKKFYKENKNIIDTINQYTTINLLLTMDSNDYGKIYNIEDLLFFYNYIIINKDKLSTISTLLEKLKNLGFEYVKFIMGYDFSKYDYELNISFPEKSNSIHYFENIKKLNIRPNIDGEKIMTYKTISSAYDFMFYIDEFNKSISTSSEIILNDLTFDANRLPSNISKEGLLYTIIKKEELKKNGIIYYYDMDINELRNIYSEIVLKINDEIDQNKKEELFVELNLIIQELCEKLNVNYNSSENSSEIVMSKKKILL